MIRRVISALSIVGTAIGIGEKLTDNELGLVRLTCRKCNQKSTPKATAARLRLTSRWGWIHILRRITDVLSLGDDDGELEIAGKHWSQMDVPTCPMCGHYPMKSRRGWKDAIEAPDVPASNSAADSTEVVRSSVPPPPPQG